MDRKGAVADFLQQCIEYTDASIKRKKERGDHEEIGAWESYREFTEHALMEINTGKLDPWFESEKGENLVNPKRIEVEHAAVMSPTRKTALSHATFSNQFAESSA